MNDTSATLRASARSTEAETSPEAGAIDERASRERTARRRQVLLDLLLDSATGSKPYVKSYRAGRGAE
jgi:hypothetical protein